MIEKMPEEYKGSVRDDSTYTHTKPRKWTEKEIEWCRDMRDKGYTNKDIAISVDRTEVSVGLKMKRLSKKKNTYNTAHVEEKYQINREFIKEINPKTILDVYCGEKSFYKNEYPDLKIVTNDLDTCIESDYTEDSLKLLCLLYYENRKFDFIDLDPYGSAYESFDLAIKMAKKGISITLGEIGHKRWKRLDFVRRCYGIESMDDFTTENIIKEIIKIGKRNKKTLIPYTYRDWKNISRVWFKIEDLKITEQWDKTNE